jgi:hypothetical protein
MSSLPRTMAAHSRHGSPSDSAPVYEEVDGVAQPNAYELQREKRKKALHDSVQLALIQSGFEDAAQLRSAFPGEGSSGTAPAAPPSTARQKRNTRHAGGGEQPRRSARNVRKELSAAPPISTTTIRETEVCRHAHAQVLACSSRNS